MQLKGGLGNQMFQYALAKHLSIKTGLPIKLDLTFLNSRLPGRQYVFRDYDLDIFDIKEKTTIFSKSPEVLRNSTYLLQKVIHKFRKIFKLGFYEEKTPFLFEKNILELKNSAYLSGYWQNERYFKDIEEEIKETFSTFSKPLSEQSKTLLGKITDTNSVCVNFRRTDYLKKENAEFFGTVSDEYYQRALALIKERVKNPHLFIFSDDIEWCEKNFKSILPITFVGHEYAGHKFSDYLRLMSACKHQVIPNSTFAWWAAWLNRDSEKIVVVPQQWAKTQYANNIIPEKWIRL